MEREGQLFRCTSIDCWTSYNLHPLSISFRSPKEWMKKTLSTTLLLTEWDTKTTRAWNESLSSFHSVIFVSLSLRVFLIKHKAIFQLDHQQHEQSDRSESQTICSFPSFSVIHCTYPWFHSFSPSFLALFFSSLLFWVQNETEGMGWREGGKRGNKEESGWGWGWRRGGVDGEMIHIFCQKERGSLVVIFPTTNSVSLLLHFFWSDPVTSKAICKSFSSLLLLLPSHLFPLPA